MHLAMVFADDFSFSQKAVQRRYYVDRLDFLTPLPLRPQHFILRTVTSNLASGEEIADTVKAVTWMFNRVMG